MPRVRKCRDNALPKKCRKGEQTTFLRKVLSIEQLRGTLYAQELSVDYRKSRKMSSPIERPECSYLSRQT